MPLFQEYFGEGNDTLKLHFTSVNINNKRWASEVDKLLAVAATAFMYAANCCSKNNLELPPGLSTWAGMTILQRAANAELLNKDPNVHSMETLRLGSMSCEAKFEDTDPTCPHQLYFRPIAHTALDCQKVCCLAGKNECNHWKFKTVR